MHYVDEEIRQGARSWEQACVTAGLVPKRLYTPVKTSFGSILLMLERIIEYRDAVNIWYGQSSQVDLQVRNSIVTEWHAVQRVFECLKPIMDTCIFNQAKESWLLSHTMSSCATLTAEPTKIAQDALPTDGSVEPGNFNYELGMYLCSAVVSSRDYIKQHLGFLEDFDMHYAHYVISLLLDPRYTTLTLLVNCARVNGSVNIPRVKQIVKTYLDVLIEWLQSAYNSMHGHDASENTREEVPEAFELFDVTSSDAANVDSVARKKFSLDQRDCLANARDRPVLKWISEREDKFPHVTNLARCVVVDSWISNRQREGVFCCRYCI